MKIVLFCHSLLSDWNHGNAHFLRGLSRELSERGHEVIAYEPRDAWSAENLVADHGFLPTDVIDTLYPGVRIERYARNALDLEAAVDGAALVLVHEWNAPELVAAIGRLRAQGRRFGLFFHDTHHRTISDPAAIERFDLEGYDAVLAFGNAVRARYEDLGFGGRVFTWHEAADVRVFGPRNGVTPARDVAFIGNWGDEERSAELVEFFLRPVRAEGVKATVHGVRYPAQACAALAEAGVEYGGYLPNYRVPDVLAAHKITVHVPRRPYAEALPGVPTIRVFEALACGIPLVSAPWEDAECLFRTGDYVLVSDGREMRRALRDLLDDPEWRRELGRRGRETILARHTCAHRIDELFGIAERVGVLGSGRERRAPDVQRTGRAATSQ